MKKALDYNQQVEATAGNDPEKLGGAYLQRANIQKAIDKVTDCAVSLKKGIEHFKAAKKENDRILPMFWRMNISSRRGPSGQIKAIIDSLEAKTETRT